MTNLLHSSAEQLEQKIRTSIPALRLFPFEIQKLTPTSIEVFAKLSDHLNHKGAAFGGSIYQIALVAAYGLFFHLIESEKTIQTRDFVIKEGNIRYKRPVTTDFIASVSVSSKQRTEFLEQLRQGRGSLGLTSEISHGNAKVQLSATLEAHFVAFFPARS